MCNETGNPAYDGYGVINKALWGSRPFAALSTGQRLLFIYLIAGPETKPGGLFEVSTASLDAVAPHVNPEDLFPLVEFEVVGNTGTRAEHLLIWVHGMYESIKDPVVRSEADQTALKAPSCALRDEYIAKHGIEGENVTGGHLSVLAAICEVTKREPSLLSIDESVRIRRIFEAGYTPEQIFEYYGQDGRWYKEDWRGLKQPPQRPNLTLIEKTIRGFRDSKPQEYRQKLNKKQVAEYMAGLQARHGRKKLKASEVKLEFENEFGPKVWEKLRDHHKWSEWANLSEDRTPFAVYEALGDI